MVKTCLLGEILMTEWLNETRNWWRHALQTRHLGIRETFADEWVTSALVLKNMTKHSIFASGRCGTRTFPGI